MELFFGIVALSIVGMILISFFSLLILNTKTIHEYDFFEVNKNDITELSNKLYDICTEKGLEGWKLEKIDLSNEEKIILIFTRSYTKPKLF